MNKSKTNISVKSNTGTRVRSSVIIGEQGTFTSGDILDANATAELVQGKVSEVIGGAGDDLDTLKEVADTIINKTASESFPATWTATTYNDTMSDLAGQILNDQNIKAGQIYCGEVNNSDLPKNNDANSPETPIRVYIDQVDDYNKQITFVVNTDLETYKCTVTSEKEGDVWLTALPFVPLDEDSEEGTCWSNMVSSVDYATKSYVNDKLDDLSAMVEITYADLVSLRNNSNLIPGCRYRITDYVTTTVQADTLSAGHQFDVIVLADSESVLNENAYATKHAGDTYFANSNLAAWELKYTLDNIYWSATPKEYITLLYGNSITEAVYDGTEILNGTTYFRWLSNSVIGPSNKVYSISKNVGDTVYYYYNNSVGSISSIDSCVRIDATGKGTITWMKDEYNNECSYDFKNIQFEVGAKEKVGTVANVFYYTFSVASGTNDATVTDYSLNGDHCYNNRIGKWITDSIQKLNFNVFRNMSSTDYCYSNTFGDSCYNNTFGKGCYNNTFGDSCYNNTFGKGCYNNTFRNSSYNNTFGNTCFSNTFGNSSYNNTFGNGCYSNTFGDSCFSNTFLKDYNYFIIIENGNRCINITSTQTTSGSNPLRNITVAQGVNNESMTKTISHNTVNDTFQTIYKPVHSVEVSV